VIRDHVADAVQADVEKEGVAILRVDHEAAEKLKETADIGLHRAGDVEQRD
jgi:hypothetical protein